MTATDELRSLLDERGVEHYDGTETTLWGYEPTSESTGAYRYAADEISGGRMQVRMYHVTPEQAIEATLGRGTCHITVQDNMTETEGMGDVWLECDACGWQMPLEPSTPRFNYCPNCGRRVEQ